MKMETRGKAIDKVYRRRDRIEMPDYQREEVWPEQKKKLLIDTILRGWHLPKFYFRKVDETSFECVDGQQRLIAIFEFFEDRLPLNPDTAARAGGSKYSELSNSVMDVFDDYEIDIEEIEDATDSDLEDLFLRLQLGTPLNTAEKLNAIGGGLRDFCQETSLRSFYSEKIMLKNTRYAHFESVVKWIFVEARGILPQMRFPQLEGLLQQNRTFSEKSETGQIVTKALEYLNEAFPEKCVFLRNRANTLSVCMLASRVVAQGLERGTADTFGRFVEDFFSKLASEVEKGIKSTDRELLRYQQAITSGSTGGDSIKTRINTLTKRLATFSPRFVTLLGTYREAEEEAVRNIGELSFIARELVYRVNRKHSASHGEDLFKMTTESAAALYKIEAPCRDASQYGEFVDAVYFLVYEGSGACNRLPTPPPQFAMDAKFLRRGLRHDVDHGNAKEFAKKKVADAQVFEKYSGKKTPGECSPEDFLTTQMRMLNEMVAFLTDLA